MKNWLQRGHHLPGRRRRWKNLARVHNTFPPAGGGGGGPSGSAPSGSTGDGGGGGVSAPSSSGGGGGGGGGGMQSPPAPSSGAGLPGPGGVAYAPPQPSNQTTPEGADPNLGMSDSLRQALDPASPGYQPNRQGQPTGQPTLPPPGTPGQPQGQQLPPEVQALVQNMRQYGVNVPDGLTPQQIYMTLAQAYNNQGQQDMYSQLGQAVAPHWDQYNQWAQQQQQAAQQPQGNQLWNPPQFDPSWLQMVETDPQTGRIRSKFGFDQRYGTMVQAYTDYMDQQQRSFWENPGQYMWQHLEPMVQQAMQGGIQNSFGQYQETVLANNVLDRHKDWLYQKDQGGRYIKAANGKNMLTPNGVRYYQYLQEAAETHGIQGTEKQNSYALRMLEGDALRYQLQQYQGGQGQNQGGMQQQGMPQMNAQRGGQTQGPPPAAGPFIPPGAGHNPNVNSLQQQVPAHRRDVQPTVEEGTGGRSLYELMREGFQATGITDQDIRNDMARTQG